MMPPIDLATLSRPAIRARLRLLRRLERTAPHGAPAA